MSLFSRTTMSLVASRKPALEPPPKPRLVGSERTLTEGKVSRMNSGLPSVEPLSTTMISYAGLPARASITEGKYFSRSSRPFQLGITTEAPETQGCGTGIPACVSAFRAPHSFQQRSVSASTPALIASRNGESTIHGSARRMRFASAMSNVRQNRAQPDLPAQPHPSRGAHQRKLLRQIVRLLL